MANEFFRAFGGDAAIAITPKGDGIMEVFANGEKIFDKKEEGYPDLAKVRKIRAAIAERIEGALVASDD